jgi:hypothetical protein
MRVVSLLSFYFPRLLSIGIFQYQPRDEEIGWAAGDMGAAEMVMEWRKNIHFCVRTHTHMHATHKHANILSNKGEEQ